MRRHSSSAVNIHSSKNFIEDREFYRSPKWIHLSKECRRRDRYTCRNCGARAKNKFDRRRFHADHIIPRSRGGPDKLENLRCLCETCHSKIHPHLARSIAARDEREKKGGRQKTSPIKSFRPSKVGTKQFQTASTKSRLY